jgi:UDP-glucose 4-epimerase
VKIAVVGSSGYIGKKLCTALEFNNHTVISYSSSSGNGINSETGRFSDGFQFPGDIDVVYYLAQSPFYRNMPEKSQHLINVNCVSALQAAESARKSGVKCFIYASTGNVYKPSFNELSESSPVDRSNWYGLSKLMAEDMLQLHKKEMGIKILRLFGVYGPNQPDKLVSNIIASVKRGDEISIYRNPKNKDDLEGLKVSLIYIDDVVKNLITVLNNTTTSEIVNIAGPEPISIVNIINIVSKIHAKRPNIKLLSKDRNCDLIADISYYKTIFGDDFVDIHTGIKRSC